MYFNSYLFLLLFLPLTLAGYYALNYLKKQNGAIIFLLGMSFWFYGYMNPKHLLILAASIFLNFGIYRLFDLKIAGGNFIRKVILFFAVAGNLGVLLLYKYYNFVVDNWNLIFRNEHSLRNFIVPLGLSFITFQQIAFAVDAYRKEVPEYNLQEYALFIAFFPHLSSGPIITHEQFMPMLRDPLRKQVNWDRFGQGLYLFAMGLGKKVLLADLFGAAVDWGYLHIPELNSFSALLVSIFYTTQIYFDFSGYSDMAIGISRMLNLDLPVNFNSPYKADTIMEFWDRWHITLTRFFTGYLYIPLGGSRCGKIRTWLNTMFVFLCSGIWHGANWTFVLWGFLHGCFQIFSREAAGILKKLPRAVNRLVTLAFVNLAWIVFRADNFDVVRQMFGTIFTGGGGGLNGDLAEFFRLSSLEKIVNIEIPAGATAIVLTVLVWILILAGKNAEEMADNLKHGIARGALVVAVIVLSLLNFSGVSSFLYFNF
ncbi:MAG: MBOAT family O-acyltransferase [Eubacteriales bacterium]|nr:MBOAT family O-acyltransferase [Eubacteriales bacterium]